MGYSYTALAGFVIESIEKQLAALMPPNSPSNGLPGGGFFEYGREQDDGAIVGTVWKTHPEEGAPYVARAGSFRIEPDGKVKRFPRVSRDILNRAEAEGIAKYKEVFGRLPLCVSHPNVTVSFTLP